MANNQRYQHPRFARMYQRLSVASERRGAGEHRDRLLGGLRGRVVEVGAGNGLNFARYPATVEEVVAVEPEDYLRAVATRAPVTASTPVHVVPGDAEHLPLDDNSCDAAVLSLVLCSVPDPHGALAEVRRVLRLGGELRFYEHVRSDKRVLAGVEDLIDPLWRRVAGGCHLNRDTAAVISAAGFVITKIDRFVFRPSPLVAQAHILGVAHLRGSSD